MSDTPPGRAEFPWFHAIGTRWMDNDIYGHVNNVQYYSYFDTAVNHFLITEGGLDIQAADVIGVCVESRCTYRAPLAFPEPIEAGVRVERLGNTSVRYGVGIFRADEPEPAAWGYFVHVFVCRQDMSPTPIPAALREALNRLA
ncbi:acyl-CoA thioesterase [Elongatibacter sediminis]|uniref:Thioesterase family protein n=1 Tax=Elongatibacter sediminis TaxID=3119006 RepID=A0AAW9R6P8_9GAMM